jgi:hypothetical integral membrane protein (TIGR02206 family)
MERFVLFGSQHVAALAAITLVTLASVAAVRRDPRSRASRTLRFGLAALLPALFLVEDGVAWREGALTLQVFLPLQLCDVARLLAVGGLLALDRRLVGPLYFFTFAGTAPALLTPDVTHAFPASDFVLLFVPHGLTVVATSVLVWGFRLVPSRDAWWRSWGLLNAWAAVVGLVNGALGTNFLFLAAKPPAPSPFDWFGPWPWYILTLEAVMLIAFFLLDLPLRPGRRRPPRAAGVATGAGRA